ncbi:MAG: type II toxin-antitoxin system HicB family antitoxin [Desulfobulbaceae bacterium]|nr:type II toxin-antitoxin system HicB family antitoxin [Desulfobulbaceae bacterium]
MKNNFFTHSGYTGSIEFDIDNEILFGKIQFINDVVTYEAIDLKELKAEFIAAVDDYLETCELIGREPQKAYKGTFNIRIGEELHRDAVSTAHNINQNLNEFCKEAIAQRVESVKKSTTKMAPDVKIHFITPEQQPATSSAFTSTIVQLPTKRFAEVQ